MKSPHSTHQDATDRRTVLLGINRSELNGIAKKLKIKNYSHGTKEELVEVIVSTKTPKEIRRITSPSFWNRYHNHVYGIASLLGVVLTIFGLVPWYQQEQKSAPPSASVTEKPPTVQPSTTPSSTERSPQRSEPFADHTKPIVRPPQTSAEIKPAFNSSGNGPTAASPPETITFVLSSRVFDKKTQAPLAGARVSVLTSAESAVQTEENGSFVLHITQKRVGQRITIRVESEGYVTQPVSIVVGGEIPNIYLEPKK